MTTNQVKVYLTYILDAITSIEELTASGRSDFEAKKHTRAAVLYYLQTMAERTQRLPDTMKHTQPEVDWIGISGFRNRLVHGYLDVNTDILWSVIENYLPDLKRAVQTMLASLDDTQAN